MSVENLVRRLRRVEGFLRKPALRRAIGGIVMVLSFGYLGHILARHWSDLAAYDWQINYALAGVGFVCYSVALGCAVLGWSLIMHRLTPSTTFSKHLKYYVYANLLKRLPAPLLDMVGRVYLYDREGVGKPLMVTASLLEWAVLILSGIVVYLLTSPFMPLPPVWRSPLIPLGLLVFGLLLVRPKTLRTILGFFGRGELAVSFTYRDLLLWLAVYSLVWLAGGVVLHVGITSIYALPVDRLPAVVGIWVVSGLIPTVMLITPVGLGLKEVTLSFLLGYLIPTHLAVIVALLMRVALILFELVWGLVVLKL
jgi:hypothetical protein